MALRKKVGYRIALIAFLATALSHGMSSDASAQYRAFAGKVREISENKMLVDNRKGDTISFVRTGETVVVGVKKSWQAIEKNDWVSVSWKMMDHPRVAYRVDVMAPKKEADR
jgi:hypothetical protein